MIIESMTGRTTQLTPELAVKAINDVLRVKRSDWTPVQADTTLDSLALDSLDLAEVLAILEDWCGFDLDPGLMLEIETVADLAKLRAF